MRDQEVEHDVGEACYHHEETAHQERYRNRRMAALSRGERRALGEADARYRDDRREDERHYDRNPCRLRAVGARDGGSHLAAAVVACEPLCGVLNEVYG